MKFHQYQQSEHSPLILSRHTKKRSRHVTLEIQDLVWNRHKTMAGLNASLNQQKNQILCATKHDICMLILVFIILFVHCLQLLISFRKFNHLFLLNVYVAVGRAWVYCLGPLVYLLHFYVIRTSIYLERDERYSRNALIVFIKLDI